MKPNLIVSYTTKERQKNKVNFCLDKSQMTLLKESEIYGNYWPNLVLSRYATNTSSRLHRRKINHILFSCTIVFKSIKYKIV